jgi:hypothetical protein
MLFSLEYWNQSSLSLRVHDSERGNLIFRMLFPHASGGNPEFMMDLFKNMLTNIRYRLQISYFLVGHAMGVEGW